MARIRKKERCRSRLCYLCLLLFNSFLDFGRRLSVSSVLSVVRQGHPQISQIFTDEFNPAVYLIRENLSNLWINLLVNNFRIRV